MVCWISTLPFLLGWERTSVGLASFCDCSSDGTEVTTDAIGCLSNKSYIGTFVDFHEWIFSDFHRCSLSQSLAWLGKTGRGWADTRSVSTSKQTHSFHAWNYNVINSQFLALGLVDERWFVCPTASLPGFPRRQIIPHQTCAQLRGRQQLFGEGPGLYKDESLSIDRTNPALV